MKEIVMAVLTALLGGGIGAAIIAALNERWKFKAQRQAAKEDREAEKEDKTKELADSVSELKEADKQQDLDVNERFKKMEEQINAVSEGMRLILLDRILQFGEYLIEKGEITYDERKRFHAMHKCYHDGLKGNGDADIIVNAVDSLPLKHREGEGHED